MVCQNKQTKIICKGNEVLASYRGVLIAPTKLNIILAKIRGKNYKGALEIFKNTPQKAGRIIWSTLHSAVSNAVNNFGFEKNDIYISQAFANQGTMLKRMQPRAKGKAYEIQRKLSHVTICLAKIEQKN